MGKVFDRPLFIVSAPRSGSTLLFETLVQHPGLYSTRQESHILIENIPELSTIARGFVSNRLDAEDATPDTVARLTESFKSQAISPSGKALRSEDLPVRFLEKTPKNSLRTDFFKRAYPDAKFVFLVRDPVANISSIIDAWHSGRFVTYPRLPDWPGSWSLLLPDNWPTMNGKAVAEIAQFQWQTANNAVLDAKASMPDDVLLVNYGAFVSDPQTAVNRICDFAELPRFTLPATLPLSRYTLTPPDKDKWHKHARALHVQLSDFEPTLSRINQALEQQSQPLLQIPASLKDVAEQQAVRQQAKITAPVNRNAPCPCGSNKRYKHCHGRL